MYTVHYLEVKTQKVTLQPHHTVNLSLIDLNLNAPRATLCDSKFCKKTSKIYLEKF